MERLRRFANNTKLFKILRTETARVTEDFHSAEGLHSAVSVKSSTDPQDIMNKQKKNLNYTDRSKSFLLLLTLEKISWSNFKY